MQSSVSKQKTKLPFGWKVAITILTCLCTCAFSIFSLLNIIDKINQLETTGLMYGFDSLGLLVYRSLQLTTYRV